MQVGIGLPNGASQVRPADLLELTVGAERLGLDSVWVVDRWLWPYAPVSMPGVPEPVEMPEAWYRSVFDPLEVLSWLAGQTSRILLGTNAINVL